MDVISTVLGVSSCNVYSLHFFCLTQSPDISYIQLSFLNLFLAKFLFNQICYNYRIKYDVEVKSGPKTTCEMWKIYWILSLNSRFFLSCTLSKKNGFMRIQWSIVFSFRNYQGSNSNMLIALGLAVWNVADATC